MIKYVALALAVAFVIPAEAGEYRWDWGIGSGDPTAGHRVSTRRRHHRPRRHKPQVMAYEKRSEESAASKKDDNGATCVDTVRGLGTQWIGTKGAMDAAKKDWMERVRYDHGESYIDLNNAKEFESRCGRTSIGEVAGQVTYRCEIVARPCKAAMQQANTAPEK